MAKNYGLIISLTCLLAIVLSQDLPCVPRKDNRSSFTCVCNATYCDTVKQMENPGPGKFILYSTNQASLRFSKTTGDLHPVNEPDVGRIINIINRERSFDASIDTSETYQEILGFGGSITDAACINHQTLSEETRKHIISSYFGKDGIEYNMIRTPVGGSDFSTHPYAYNEEDEGDVELLNFKLTTEDFDCKIPMLKEALSQSTDEVLLSAASWSPPPWMKSSNDFGGFSMLKKEYYYTWALYHLKYLQEYKKQGLEFWSISTGNEPSLGLIPWTTFNCLGWTPRRQADWISNHFGPQLRASEFANLKLIAIDDQRFKVPLWINSMQRHNNNTMSYVDGIGLHWYWDFFPGNFVDRTREQYPDKFLLGTEACAGSNFYEFEKVALGSWRRARKYAENIIDNLNRGYTGWIDWNLVLDKQGGPNWFDNFVDAPIISLPESDEFLKQPMFYAMGHFSKFLPRGSVRVRVDTNDDIPHVAFTTPKTPLVVILYNTNSRDLDVTLNIGNEELKVTVTANSLNTINIWPSNS